ncbi:MAG: preprotein translocase subunit YajC [Bacteroidales bacterium]|nr:preprotein translocase subunit YajC [Bacteroidales bacterium]MBR6330707.1 preprotein translocase subunit YajC [Bacteroidales bacterium]
MNILFVMLQQGAPSGAGGSGLIMIILLFVVMWLLMIRPQNKKAKEEAKMREQLKKGDRVLFSGGIYGKVHSVEATTVDVEISNGVIVTVEKSFIQALANNQNE